MFWNRKEEKTYRVVPTILDGGHLGWLVEEFRRGSWFAVVYTETKEDAEKAIRHLKQ